MDDVNGLLPDDKLTIFCEVRISLCFLDEPMHASLIENHFFYIENVLLVWFAGIYRYPNYFENDFKTKALQINANFISKLILNIKICNLFWKC